MKHCRQSEKFVCTAEAPARGQVAKLQCRPLVEVKKSIVNAASATRVTKYIQAGALNGGDGSKHHPWNDLAVAEANDWTTLIILPSNEILYGGITLFDGQQLRGQQKDQALLANIDPNNHNGDVIVVQGNVRIQNVTVVAAYRCAIEALNAKNLHVSNFDSHESNALSLYFNSDILQDSEFQTSTLYWPAISFFGGPTVFEGVQPLNQFSGTFILENSLTDNYSSGVIVGSGDSYAVSAVPPTYFREYKITETKFRSSFSSDFSTGTAITPFAGSGAVLSGSVTKCSFDHLLGDIYNPCNGIVFYTVNSNPYYPGRGNTTLKRNLIENNKFDTILGFGVIAVFSADLLGTEEQIVVENNHFNDVGTTPGDTSPAGFQQANPSIQLTILEVGSGQITWDVKKNKIFDSTGKAPAINTYLAGSPTQVTATIHHNLIKGTASSIDTMINPNGDGDYANGVFKISNNTVVDTDSAITAFGAANIETNVSVVVEYNCFEKTGNREAQLGRNPVYNPAIPHAGASYFGGTIIYGGETTNPAIAYAVTTPVTTSQGLVLDLGGGALGSHGHNNFLKTVGPHTWVEAGLFLAAERNWFGSEKPRDAGEGGEVDFKYRLHSGPHNCHDKSHSSSSSH